MAKKTTIPYTDDNICLFQSRFSTGRWAVQGDLNKTTGATQYEKGEKEHLTTELIKKHLDSEITLGSYCIGPQNDSIFLVIDFDIDTIIAKSVITKPGDKKAKEKYAEALRVMQEQVKKVIGNLSEKLGIGRNQVLIEKSGAKGYHLWMFFSQPTPSLKVYKMTRVISRELELQGYEIYPMQASADDLKVGSLIKIPLGINKKTGERCFFLDDTFEPFLDQWKALADVSAITDEQLNNLIKLRDTEAERIEEDTIEDVTSIGGSIDRMIDSCDALKALQEKSEKPPEEGGEINLSHDERMTILSLFKKFGNVGKMRIHQFLKNTHNYNAEKTDKIISSANVTPMKCSTLRERGICSKECEAIVDACGKSPIKLAMDKTKSITSAYILNSLSEIENPLLCEKRIRVDFTMTAMVDNPYYSTKTANFAPCSAQSCPNYSEKCECEEKDLVKTVTIGSNRKEHIQMYGADDQTSINLIRKKVSGCTMNKCLQTHKSFERYIVQPFACSNVVQALGEMFDEKERAAEAKNNPDKAAKESKDYIAFFLGNSLETSKVYRGYGTVLPNPHSSAITILFDKVDPIYGQVDTFEVNETNKHHFDIFKAMSLKEKIDDLRENITYIHGRDDLILAVLLTHLSVLEFSFNNAPLSRGWIETMVIGDSGQAKSTLVERIVNYVGLGRIEYSNATVAGLIGGVTNLQTKKYLQWGVLPKCHKGLLFLDEIQNLPPELWGQLRTIRTSGVAKITKINQGSQPAKVRLVCAANAKPNDKELADFKYGASALASILNPADIRRFDLACFLSKKDLDKDYANTMNEHRPARISREMLRDVVTWAWSRKPEHVVFTPQVTEAILREAKFLSGKFGGSSAVPLANASDMREKIARLTVATAVLNIRSEDYVVITPTLEDVNFVKSFLDKIYAHPNVALDLESSDKKKETEIDEEQYIELKNHMRSVEFKSMGKVLDAFIDINEVRPLDLAGWVDAKPEEVSKVITLLSKYQMIYMSKFGTYTPKPKLIRFIKRLAKEKSDEGNAV